MNCVQCGEVLQGRSTKFCSDPCRSKYHNQGRNHNTGGGVIWTRQNCIDALRDFFDEHGRAPVARELGAGSMQDTSHEKVRWLPTYGTFIQRFGSYKAALEAAGLPARAPGYRLSIAHMQPKDK